jgi:hypothetical protein
MIASHRRLNFLELIDKFSLMRFPRLWVAKLHRVLFFSLIVNGLVFTIYWLLLRRQIDTISLWKPTILPLFWILLLVEAVYLGYWWYRQTLFSIEKELGETNSIIGPIEQILHFSCLLLIMSPSIFLSFLIRSEKAYSYSLPGYQFWISYTDRYGYIDWNNIATWQFVILLLSLNLLFCIKHTRWSTFALYVILWLALTLIWIILTGLIENQDVFFDAFFDTTHSIILVGIFIYIPLIATFIHSIRRKRRTKIVMASIATLHLFSMTIFFVLFARLFDFLYNISDLKKFALFLIEVLISNILLSYFFKMAFLKLLSMRRHKL